MSTRIIYGEELVFNDTGRSRYTWAGQPVPGVTTILGNIAKPQLYKWYADMAADYWHKAVKEGRTDYAVIRDEAAGAPNARKESAGASGTNVHAYAEAFFKKLPLPELTSDDAKRGVEAFHDWLNSYTIEVLAVERTLFSKEHYYAGTCDFVAKIDGELCVGDIKTSSGIYNDHRFQTAAYQHALQEETGAAFTSRWIVRFDKKTSAFEARRFTEFDLDFQGFNAALMLHRTFKAMKPAKRGA